jgi:hypothetical protein
LFWIILLKAKKIGVSRGDPKISASNPVSQVLW